MEVQNPAQNPLRQRTWNSQESFAQLQRDLKLHIESAGHEIVTGYHSYNYDDFALERTKTVWKDAAGTVPRYRLFSKYETVINGNLVYQVAGFYRDDGTLRYELKYTDYLYETGGGGRILSYKVEEKFYEKPA